MKKIISIILSVLLIATSSISAFSVFAVDSMLITAEDKECFVGETVDVTIKIKDNPGFSYMRLTVKYDDEVLTLIKAVNGTIMKDFTQGLNLLWDAVSDSKENGTLVTLTFKVNEGAEDGNYPITVILRELYNNDLDDVEANVQNGSIQVKHRPVDVTGVSLDKHELSLKTGEVDTLTATVSPDNATDKELVWESSNEDVVTVDNGEVTAVGKGNATITVKTADGGFTDTCEVTVACAHANKTEVPAMASTCTERGNNLYYVCDDCGAVLKADGVTVTSVSAETLPLADHTYTHFDEDPATHYASGTKEHYMCEDCGKIFDKNKVEVTDESTLVIPQIPHSYGDWVADDVNHWHECGCGNIIDEEAHNFVWKTDKAATEDETGLKHEECTVCGTVRNENTVIPKLEHTHNMSHIAAVAATCKTEGNVEYYHCAKCGKNYADANGSTELATVVTPINPANHTGGTKLVGKKDATCTEKGYTGDTVCNGCGAVLAKGKEIAATGHNADNTGWHTDGTSHWHTCKCGEILDKAAHIGGTANCHQKAKCDVCGAEYGALNPNNHDGETEIRNAVDATEEKEGYTGDKYCLGCNALLEKGQSVPKLEHTHAMVKTAAKAPTHEENGNIEYYTCSKCGKLYKDADGKLEITLADTVIDALGHEYSEDYSFDSENHWYECGCGNKIDVAAHEFGEWTVTKEATETEKGSKERVCAVCGYKEIVEIPAIGTPTEPTNPVEPTEPTTPDVTDPSVPNTSNDAKSLNTGDGVNMIAWIALLSASGISAFAAIFYGKKKRKAE